MTSRFKYVHCGIAFSVYIANSVSDWCREDKLSLSVGNCNTIVIDSAYMVQHEQLNINRSDIIVQQVDRFKHLIHHD